MNKILFILLTFIAFKAFATTQYVASKNGLILRELPNKTSIQLEKVPYGEKLSTQKIETNTEPIVIDNINGEWLKTTYKGKTGYIASCYLLNVPPPKLNTKTLIDYFNQLSIVAYKSVYKKNEKESFDDDVFELTKSIYKNSFETHEALFYEANEDAYYLFNFSFEQAFILCKLIEETNVAFDKIDNFPTSNITKKDTSNQITYSLDVHKLNNSDIITDIHVEFGNDYYQFLNIKMVAGQLVIAIGGGV